MQMKSKALRCACALPAIAALSIAGVSGASARDAGAAAVPRCATSGLVVWLNGEGSGAAGSFFYKLEFTNLSGRTCTLAGYPGVSAVGLSGRQIGAAARREPGNAARTITLAPEADASATVRVVDVGVLPASCRPVTAAGLRVYPPGQRIARIVPFPFRACTNARQVSLAVQAVGAG